MEYRCDLVVKMGVLMGVLGLMGVMGKVEANDRYK